MDEVLLGAAVLPVRDVIDASRVNADRDDDRPAGRVETWLDVIGPHRTLRSSDMSDVNFRMRVTRSEGLGGGAGKSASASGSSPSGPCTAGTCGRWPGPAGRRTWTTRSKGWWRRRRDWSPLCSRPSPRRSPRWRTLSRGVRRDSTTRGSRGTPRCACALGGTCCGRFSPCGARAGRVSWGTRAPWRGTRATFRGCTRAAGCCGPCRSARVTSRSGVRRRRRRRRRGRRRGRRGSVGGGTRRRHRAARFQTAPRFQTARFRTAARFRKAPGAGRGGSGRWVPAGRGGSDRPVRVRVGPTTARHGGYPSRTKRRYGRN